MTTYAFGRRKALDRRDQGYKLRGIIQMGAPIRTAPWHAEPSLDQSNTGIPARDGEGSCTGFGAAHFLAAAPHMHVVTPQTALQLYDFARRNDEWPGEAYDGSSVRGVLKGMLAAGCIKGGYLWAWHAETVRDYVQRYGPVITGTDWYAGMLEPDVHGMLTPTGPNEGGHCWLILGYSVTRNAFRMQNSWGLQWGEQGRAWIGYDEYAFLLEQDGGEAASAIEVVA